MEFEASARTQDTSVSFGYQLDVPKANLQFKGKDVFRSFQESSHIFTCLWQIKTKGVGAVRPFVR